MDLALNNLQRLICHKTQTPTNQPTNQSILSYFMMFLLYELEENYMIDLNNLM